MTRHTLRILATLAAATSLTVATSRADDFGAWGEIAVQKNLGKHFAIDMSGDFRFEDNLSQFSRYGIGWGVAYKPVKYFTLGAGYTYIRDYVYPELKTKYDEDEQGRIELDDNGTPDLKGYNLDQSYWRTKHRVTIDATGKLPIGRFTISLRERYQHTHTLSTTTTREAYRKEWKSDPASYTGTLYTIGGKYFRKMEYREKQKASKSRQYLRSRLALDYSIRHCPWTPYTSVEASNDLDDHLHLDKVRITLGAEWKISKHHRMDFAYIYNNGNDDDNDSDIHAISIGYKYKF